jgi:predicted ribosome quality control (RQC) complex YloA/Tae2 family protein
MSNLPKKRLERYYHSLEETYDKLAAEERKSSKKGDVIRGLQAGFLQNEVARIMERVRNQLRALQEAEDEAELERLLRSMGVNPLSLPQCKSSLLKK